MITGNIPESSSKNNIINPTISSPIRLFSPIVLPQPITINNSSTELKE